MKKTLSLFARNYDGDRLVRDELVPGAEWVAAGEGVATRKWDGLAVMIDGDRVFRRYDAKAFTLDGNKKRAYNRQAPQGFLPAGEPDEKTGHWPGWLPCTRENTEDKWIWEGVDNTTDLADGTYELIGPKIGTRGGPNPEKTDKHLLVRHGADVFPDAPRTFDELRAYLSRADIEGIVWHHPDGRMVKIKAKDFGFKRAVAPEG